MRGRSAGCANALAPCRTRWKHSPTTRERSERVSSVTAWAEELGRGRVRTPHVSRAAAWLRPRPDQERLRRRRRPRSRRGETPCGGLRHGADTVWMLAECTPVRGQSQNDECRKPRAASSVPISQGQCRSAPLPSAPLAHGAGSDVRDLRSERAVWAAEPTDRLQRCVSRALQSTRAGAENLATPLRGGAKNASSTWRAAAASLLTRP